MIRDNMQFAVRINMNMYRIYTKTMTDKAVFNITLRFKTTLFLYQQSPYSQK